MKAALRIDGGLAVVQTLLMDGYKVGDNIASVYSHTLLKSANYLQILALRITQYLRPIFLSLSSSKIVKNKTQVFVVVVVLHL